MWLFDCQLTVVEYTELSVDVFYVTENTKAQREAWEKDKMGNSDPPVNEHRCDFPFCRSRK